MVELGLTKGAARQRLNLALGSVVGDGKAAHHIVPLDAITNARTSSIVEAAARGGFSMNGANNGVLLSQLFHRGGHDKTIERMLRKIEKLKGSDKHIAGRLQTIVDAERTFLSQIETTRLAATQAGLRGRIHMK
ncbi:MAG: AHH domain-containing protein [Pirellulaceae bacterium]